MPGDEAPKSTHLLTWIGQQLQADGGDLPVWSQERMLWYVRSADRYFDQFNVALGTAMQGRRVHYLKMRAIDAE